MLSLFILLGICWLSTATADGASSRDPAPTSGLEAQIRDLAERVLQLEERDVQQRQEIDDLRSVVKAKEQRQEELERHHQSDIGHLKKELRVNQRRISFLENIIEESRHKASSAKQRDNEPAKTTPDTDNKDTQTSQKGSSNVRYVADGERTLQWTSIGIILFVVGVAICVVFLPVLRFPSTVKPQKTEILNM